MIVPTIGRRIYYKPYHVERENSGSCDNEQPFDAGILYVHSDHLVNLLITSHLGGVIAKTSVTLAQDREPVEGECYWMPYQVKAAE